MTCCWIMAAALHRFGMFSLPAGCLKIKIKLIAWFSGWGRGLPGGGAKPSLTLLFCHCHWPGGGAGCRQ